MEEKKHSTLQLILKVIENRILRFMNNLKRMNWMQLSKFGLKKIKNRLNEKKLKALRNDLNLICDENGLLRYEVRLKLAPLPYYAKMPYLINSEHNLARLIVECFHRDWKHVTIKQTLSELRQKFWICRSRAFVRKVLKGCVRYILLVCFECLKERTYERRKNVFNFTSKTLFVLEIIKF